MLAERCNMLLDPGRSKFGKDRQISGESLPRLLRLVGYVEESRGKGKEASPVQGGAPKRWCGALRESIGIQSQPGIGLEHATKGSIESTCYNRSIPFRSII